MILAIDASRANQKEKTGVEWYSYFLIQEFKKIIPADIAVRLYIQKELNADLLPLPPNWEVKILRWPFRFWTVFRFSWEILLNKPDILFIPANIIPFFAPKKTFTTIHDIGFKRFPECYGKTERWLQDFGTKRAIRKARVIFTPSEFTKKELVNVYGANAKNIIPISLGFNFSTKSATETDVLQKHGIKKPYFLYVGRKEYKKNIKNIIEGFKIFNEKNSEYYLVLVGKNGYGWDKIEKPKNIISLNWLPNNDIKVLMENAEIFLFPSLYEGFGMPILEAMSCGTPVITSNCASMPEIAGDAAYLVNPNNASEIAKAIKTIMLDEQVKKELKEKGVLRSKKFSWEKCAENSINSILKLN